MESLNSFFHCTVDFIIFNHSNCYHRMHSARVKWRIYERGATMQAMENKKQNKTKQNGGVIKNKSFASSIGTFHLSPHENILTIARMKTFIICIIYDSCCGASEPEPSERTSRLIC